MHDLQNTNLFAAFAELVLSVHAVLELLLCLPGDAQLIAWVPGHPRTLCYRWDTDRGDWGDSCGHLGCNWGDECGHFGSSWGDSCDSFGGLDFGCSDLGGSFGVLSSGWGNSGGLEYVAVQSGSSSDKATPRDTLYQKSNIRSSTAGDEIQSTLSCDQRVHFAPFGGNFETCEKISHQGGLSLLTTEVQLRPYPLLYLLIRGNLGTPTPDALQYVATRTRLPYNPIGLQAPQPHTTATAVNVTDTTTTLASAKSTISTGDLELNVSISDEPLTDSNQTSHGVRVVEFHDDTATNDDENDA
ncbi:unnamed protein product [Phytophthora fragariaefolia]|uniref:Unnamed protein product n=1 Tax=Phytophthora fragariaefolia TaxID=1490495 RepID=A0A9W6TKF3_9STRA|nr:unnamed protein product [Phytophthora fragariaefolia]